MSVKIKNIKKSFSSGVVLNGIDLTLEDDTIYCLMGPSGIGKTTLLRIITGLEKQDSGVIKGLEKDDISVMFQEDRLLPGMDAEGNLRFVLGTAWDEGRAAALLGELGLAAVGEKPVRDYSGGMQRRLALARALLIPFDLLLLDEPFAGLDRDNRDRAANCVRRHGAGRTVLAVTHDERDAAALGAEILRL